MAGKKMSKRSGFVIYSYLKGSAFLAVKSMQVSQLYVCEMGIINLSMDGMKGYVVCQK